MPFAYGNTHPNVIAVGMGSEGPLAPMSASVAVLASRNDVGLDVPAAVLSCLQMFRSALIVVRGAKARAQFGGGRKPHSSGAVVAPPVLSMKCDRTKGLKGGHMKGSEESKKDDSRALYEVPRAPAAVRLCRHNTDAFSDRRITCNSARRVTATSDRRHDRQLRLQTT